MKDSVIYFDNAATTPLREEVKQRMIELLDSFGNPSSTHQVGRKSKLLVENARKFIADSLNCSTGEIIFTSGGTESDNAALFLPVLDLGIKRIITSPVEHHAVLHTAEAISKRYNVELDIVRVDERGEVDMNHLEELLQRDIPTLVSLMHANNELGNILDIKAVGNLCRKYNALFHSDTVQTVGHYHLDLQEIPVDFITGAAHKFYGPKGVGFLFIRNRHRLSPLIRGGAQERNMRAGTENILGIAGMHTALKCALENLEQEREQICALKQYFISRLKEVFGDELIFNGNCKDDDKSLYTVLSVGFPNRTSDSTLLFKLDMKGIACSGGSACSSGSVQGSHVIGCLYPDNVFPVIRFSLSKNNTREEVDRCVSILQEIISPVETLDEANYNK